MQAKAKEKEKAKKAAEAAEEGGPDEDTKPKKAEKGKRTSLRSL